MKSRVQIKCLVNNNLYPGKYDIKIYDNKNNLICHSINNKISFNAYHYIPYKIIIIPLNSVYSKVLYKSIVFTPNNCHIIKFYFHEFKERPHTMPITLNVTDKNYKGLNIMKGEIKLWQNHIQ